MELGLAGLGHTLPKHLKQGGRGQQRARENGVGEVEDEVGGAKEAREATISSHMDLGTTNVSPPIVTILMLSCLSPMT